MSLVTGNWKSPGTDILVWLFIFVAFFGVEEQIASQDNPHGNLKHACNDCHTTKAWSPLRLNLRFKHEQTGFALEGHHALVQCRQCHTSLKFTGASRDCKACHTDLHDGKLGLDCARCHTFQAWREISKISVVHQSSRFPLIGQHQYVGCDDCHRVQGESQFINLPLNCAACHRQDYEATRNPNHRLAGFATRCETCHSSGIASWTDAHFEHPPRFPLIFGHARATCSECHVSAFRGISTMCFSCHQEDYRNTRNPNHGVLGYSTDCRRCHTLQGWGAPAVDHSFFPLVGAHTAVGCNGCHANNVFQGTPRDCFSCHQIDFNRTTDPNHVTGNFSHTCTQCHNENAWRPATFDHSLTNFALLGAHRTVDCSKCHLNGTFAGTPKDCWSCHQTDYQQTTNPNHVAGNYPRDCQPCHNSTAWRPATFDHNRSRFPLTGAHLAVPCSQCHVSNRFTGTPADCYSCHQADFQRPTNPNHVAGGFSRTCTLCHTTTAWKPSTFDHNATRFPLQGAHVAVTCNQCHVNNRFAGTPSDCYSCHQGDFQRATNPNHLTLNFSHDCMSCHTLSAWTPSTFDHDGQYFRIYSGKHRGKWQTCATCHVNPADYKMFECINCHEHSQQKMDDKHRNRPDYQYNSQACYRCHSRV